MNVTQCTDSTCGLISTQVRRRANVRRHDNVRRRVNVRRHDNVLKERTRSCKGVTHFMCDTCGKQLIDLSQLKVHETTHTPFSCDICGKSFVHSGSLTSHDKIHKGVTPFTFDTYGNIHAQSIVFTCHQCGKSFVHSKTLKVHERTHSRC